MKFIVTVFALFCLSFAHLLPATQLFVYNHGYVLGELNAVKFTGLNRKIVSGEVSIGNNSFGGDSGFRNQLQGDYVLHNPWSFCADKEFYETLSAYIGEFAIIEYRTPKKSSLLQCQSTNEILAIYPVSRTKPTGLVRESKKIYVAGKPFGVSVGRIVNAQKSDRYDDNWSVVIQVGNGGNDFRYLQIVDADLYAFALDCLASATKVKLYHIEQIQNSARADRIESYVWKIEAKPGL